MYPSHHPGGTGGGRARNYRADEQENEQDDEEHAAEADAASAVPAFAVTGVLTRTSTIKMISRRVSKPGCDGGLSSLGR
jgi:hypothetical protein